MIKALAHVCFTVRDIEASVAFYRDKLGFTPAFDFVKDGKRHGAYLHIAGRSFIEMFQGALTQPAEGQTYRHLCLEVEDIQAAAAELRSRGVEVSQPKLGGDNSWQAWIRDVDGNRIELHCYGPDSKQSPSLR